MAGTNPAVEASRRKHHAAPAKWNQKTFFYDRPGARWYETSIKVWGYEEFSSLNYVAAPSFCKDYGATLYTFAYPWVLLLERKTPFNFRLFGWWYIWNDLGNEKQHIPCPNSMVWTLSPVICNTPSGLYFVKRTGMAYFGCGSSAVNFSTISWPCPLHKVQSWPYYTIFVYRSIKKAIFGSVSLCPWIDIKSKFILDCKLLLGATG